MHFSRKKFKYPSWVSAHQSDKGIALSHWPHHPPEECGLAEPNTRQRRDLEYQDGHEGVERDLPESPDVVAFKPE